MTDTDRDLLEMAARAAGVEWTRYDAPVFGPNQWRGWGLVQPFGTMDDDAHWNPLTDDGDALMLAVKLRLDIEFEGGKVVFADGNFSEFAGDDPFAATRRAIVRAAASFGDAK